MIRPYALLPLNNAPPTSNMASRRDSEVVLISKITVPTKSPAGMMNIARRWKTLCQLSLM